MSLLAELIVAILAVNYISRKLLSEQLSNIYLFHLKSF